MTTSPAPQPADGERRMSVFDHEWRLDTVGQWWTDCCDLCGEPQSAHVLREATR